MSEQLDRLIELLAVAANDRPLDHMEADVRRGIALRRAQARAAAALAPVGLASVSLALAMGAAVGGMTAATAASSHSSNTFSVATELAPSTLLEGGR